MPVCGYITSYSIRAGPQAQGNRIRRGLGRLFELLEEYGLLEFNRFKPQSYTISFEATGLDSGTFANILSKAYPATTVTSLDHAHTGSEISLDGDMPRSSDFRRLLEVLKKHITIMDTLDETHVLSLHNLPPTAGRTQWKRFRLGDLVYKAKS